MSGDHTEAKPDRARTPGFSHRVLPSTAAGCGMGCATVLGLSLLATWMGFCLFLPDTVMKGGLLCVSVAFITATAFHLRGRPMPVKLVLAEIALVALVWTSYSVWTAPKALFRLICRVEPAPPVVIHQSHLFQITPDALAFLHFSAPPEVMERFISTNQLTRCVEEPDEVASEYRFKLGKSGFAGSATPRWWTPWTLSKPIHYRCEHPSQKPWAVGVWVNDKTNEAFAYQW